MSPTTILTKPELDAGEASFSRAKKLTGICSNALSVGCYVLRAYLDKDTASIDGVELDFLRGIGFRTGLAMARLPARASGQGGGDALPTLGPESSDSRVPRTLVHCCSEEGNLLSRPYMQGAPTNYVTNTKRR